MPHRASRHHHHKTGVPARPTVARIVYSSEVDGPMVSAQKPPMLLLARALNQLPRL